MNKRDEERCKRGCKWARRMVERDERDEMAGDKEKERWVPLGFALCYPFGGLSVGKKKRKKKKKNGRRKTQVCVTVEKTEMRSPSFFPFVSLLSTLLTSVLDSHLFLLHLPSRPIKALGVSVRLIGLWPSPHFDLLHTTLGHAAHHQPDHTISQPTSQPGLSSILLDFRNRTRSLPFVPPFFVELCFV